MRYFFFNYIVSNDTHHAYGNIWFESETFPSNSILKAKAIEKFSGMSAVVMGWQEFKSRNDYVSFCGDEKLLKNENQ